ncbi:MAG: ferrous iron transport protein B [Candidatus Schekmanbacteria bacterium]|nr:ferrous iron transport protein B [Candidatus Schekmanbacteria bacterium]
MDQILLVGNPNVGKSALFSALTGRYATISNYPGTTVEISRAELAIGERRFEVIDTPGTTTLMAQSEDQAVTERILLANPTATITCVVDARQLRRGLALALSLADLGAPMVVALNMMDEAREAGYEYDVAKLEQLLGVPVVETVAVTKQGIGRLRDALLQSRAVAQPSLRSQELELAVRAILALIPAQTPMARALAVLALMGDPLALQRIHAAAGDSILERISVISRQAQAKYAANLTTLLPAERFRAAERLAGEVTRRRPQRPGRVADFIGRAAMHPVWGWPILIGVLYGVYLFVGVLGAGEAVDFFENTLFAHYITPALEACLRFVLPNGAIESFVVSAPGQAETGPGLLIGNYGLLSMGLSYAVAIVLPIVAFFFVAFALMEDSGYLPRLAVMLDRAFGLMGLNGKAVLPLVLGLGCDTMATMTTRVLATRKERTLVILLLALGVPCSAQLGVILAMMAALSGRAFAIWVGAVSLAILLAGAVGSRLIPGKTSDFVIEIPPVRRPRAKNVALKTVSRVEWYLREAVPLFMLGTAVLWVMDALNLLKLVETAFAPIVVGLLDLPRETAEAFLIGFLRRDYGAAGLYHTFAPVLEGGAAGPLVERQIVVSMVTITLFLPCVANFFMIIKEKGLKTATAISGVVLVSAILGGTTLRLLMEASGW